jgi:hypothetical protein
MEIDKMVGLFSAWVGICQSWKLIRWLDCLVRGLVLSVYSILGTAWEYGRVILDKLRID